MIDAKNIEAALVKDEQGRQVWTCKDAELGMSERILALNAEAPDLNQTEIADELGCDKSTVSRTLKKAEQQSAGVIPMSRLKRLLHVAIPSTCNTQQKLMQVCRPVAQHAHNTQQAMIDVETRSSLHQEEELRRLVQLVSDHHDFS